MYKKLRAILIIALVTVLFGVFALLPFFITPSAVSASAEETQTEQTEQTDGGQGENTEQGKDNTQDTDGEQNGENGEPDSTENTENTEPTDSEKNAQETLKAYLKSVYGEEKYEQYYNEILKNWGTAENFLINAGKQLPEEYQYKIDDVLLKANGYAGIIADVVLLILALGVILIAYKNGKKSKEETKQALQECKGQMQNLLKNVDVIQKLVNQAEQAQVDTMEAIKKQSVAMQAIIPADFNQQANEALQENITALTEAEKAVQEDVSE